MPFSLVNAPVTFQAMISHIFRDMLGRGTLAITDDIMIHAAEKETPWKSSSGLKGIAYAFPQTNAIGLCKKLNSWGTSFLGTESK